MLTHRMVAARGQKSNSKIGQAASVGGHSGRFVTFEEANTNFTDKINSEDFIAFPQGVDEADFDVDVTEQIKPTIQSGGTTDVTTDQEWGDFGSNDFLLMVCAEAIVGQAPITLSPSNNEYTPSYADDLYGGCIAAYVGGTGVDYARCDVQPYRFRFRYGGAASSMLATPWSSKWRSREHEVAYCFAGGRRGNDILHFAYKDGDADGELTGSTTVDPAAMDAAFGDSDFSDMWAATKFNAFSGFTHSSYGCYSQMCIKQCVASTGEERWLPDAGTQNQCSEKIYAAWSDCDEEEPNLTQTGTSIATRFYVRDSADAFQMVGGATPISGENSAPNLGAVNHPSKYYFVMMIEFPNGMPANRNVINSMMYMLERAKAGDKVIDPTLIY